MLTKFSKYLSIKNTIFLLCAIFLFFGLTTTANATTYYLDPNSVNGCNGAGQSTSLTLSNEMLTDGGMEGWTNSTTLANWTKSVSGSSSLNQDSISPYAGAYSARFDIDGSTSNVFIYQGTTALMTANHKYRLSFYAKGTASFGIQPGYRGSSFSVIANPTLTTSWTQYEYFFSPTQNSRIEIGRQSGQGANQSFYVDSVSLAEVTGDCAWSGTSKITGLVAGDNVNFKRGEIFRGNALTIPASGTNGNPISFDAYGSGVKPVLTKLIDYSSSAGFSWVDGGTGDSSVLKLTGTITDPLLSPWGVLNGGHPEFNFLTNGSFETWSGPNPTSWATSTSGTSIVSHVTTGAYTTDGGTNSISLTPDASNSDVNVSQSVTLSADTVYAFRIIHKETGTAVPLVRVKKTSGGTSYWNFTTATWQDGATTKSLLNRASYYDSWMYFKTPVGSSATYEILLGNGANSASQTLYFDQVIVMEKKQLNNNFMVATTPNSSWATSKFSSLNNRETGLSAGSLNPGEWYWEDEILYYHLANGENSVTDTHIEVAQGNWTSANVDGIVNGSKNYINISNLEVGYFQKYLVSISGSFSTIQNIYSHHGDMAYLINGAPNSIYLYNDIGAYTFEHSYYDMGSNGNRYWNCMVYKTQTDNGLTLYNGVTNVSIKNFIVSDVDTDSFAMVSAPFTQGAADHLLYDGNIFSGWPTTGMNNVVANPLFTNPSVSDFTLQFISPAIDSGTNVGLTTDYTGTNHIYGTPDIGAYEYQPPYTIGSDLVDPTGSIRIYSDGKYRYTTATSSTQTANFSVSPVGSWPSSDYSEYMNVTLDSWLTSGTKNKQWTATSSIATNTIYTIGNLAPSKYYQFKLDGVASTTAIAGDTCTNGLCLSDSSGNLTFTYTGGYSTHTFALEQNTGAPTNIGISSVSADSTTQLTITSQIATDVDPGLHATPYWFNETSGHSGGSSSSDWQISTSFVDSGLSANTQYTYQVKARDNNLNESEYSETLSKYTLAPVPTNLSASSNSNSVSLSVDSLPNDASGSSGYYFSRSGANSGWIQTNSWTDSSLSCGHEYTYTAIYRNGDGTETSPISTAKSTSGCGGGGSPAMWTLPTVPAGGFKLTINSGALTTSNRNVFLSFNAGADIKKIAISMTGEFTDASQEDYIASRQWDLCSKFGGLIKNPICPDGKYTVYAKFYTAYGRTTGNAFASSSITLGTTTGATISAKYNFTKNLSLNSAGADVKKLQQFLNTHGFVISKTGAGSPGKETTLFGTLTYKALVKFQKSIGWSGTGFFGPMTRDYINKQ